MNVRQQIERGFSHHRAGRLAEAEKFYRQVLTQQPNHAEALHLLGMLAGQCGQLDAAEDLLRRAIRIKPDYAEAHATLGTALKRKGRLDEAIDSFRQAIRLKPGLPGTHTNLANALKDKGNLDVAIASYREAIRLKPDYAEAHNNLGNALRDKGQLDDAIASHSQAIRLKPDYAEAHGDLGTALAILGRFDEAIYSLSHAIGLNPDLAVAHSNLGNALRSKGRLDEAIASFQHAIWLKPDSAETHANLGNALRDNGQLDAAIASYSQAVQLKPGLAGAHSNLANALKDTGQLDEAIACYRQAIQLKPDHAGAHSSLPFVLQYHPDYDATMIHEELRLWSSRHAEPLKKFIRPHENNPDPDRPLRIGYVSPDFRADASANFLVPLLEHHDPCEVELICYAEVPRPDEITTRLRRPVAQWLSTLGLSDEKVAQQIRQDRIDVLVDLAVHTAGNRLLVFARKPAPVQVTWLGYPGTTGLQTIDYRLSDPYLDPPGMDESVYSERTLRLPESFWCYDPLDGRDIPISSLPALERGAITFGSLNNFCKISEPVLVAWSRILKEVPGSQLLLHAPEGVIASVYTNCWNMRESNPSACNLPGEYRSRNTLNSTGKSTSPSIPSLMGADRRPVTPSGWACRW